MDLSFNLKNDDDFLCNITRDIYYVHTYSIARHSFVPQYSTSCRRNGSGRHSVSTGARPISPASLTSAFSISRIVRGRCWMQEGCSRTAQNRRGRGTRGWDRERIYRGTETGWGGKPGRFSSRLTTAARVYRCRQTHPLVCYCIKFQRCNDGRSGVPCFKRVRRSHVRGTANKRQSSERLPLFIPIAPFMP